VVARVKQCVGSNDHPPGVGGKRKQSHPSETIFGRQRSGTRVDSHTPTSGKTKKKMKENRESWKEAWWNEKRLIMQTSIGRLSNLMNPNWKEMYID